MVSGIKYGEHLDDTFIFITRKFLSKIRQKKSTGEAIAFFSLVDFNHPSVISDFLSVIF
jgi:hypothetical protein